MRPDIKAFQGRKMVPLGIKDPKNDESEIYVTPDFGIVLNEKIGLLGEVKKNIPTDDPDRATKVFQQLKKYDQKLVGWPVSGEQIDGHHLVLLIPPII
jgi:hypothetical protein